MTGLKAVIGQINIMGDRGAEIGLWRADVSSPCCADCRNVWELAQVDPWSFYV